MKFFNIIIKMAIVLFVVIALIGAVFFGIVLYENIDVFASSTDVSDIHQIDEALEYGPVLLKLGAEWCPPCKEQDPIMDDLAKEYRGSATVMSIDIDENPEFMAFFNVRSIPDICVIVDIENGQYIYMASDGSTSTQREYARFLGFTNQIVLSKTLNRAIEFRTL